MGEVHDLFPDMKVSNENDKARAERCLSRIVEVLKEENCGILPDFRVLGLQMSSGIVVIAKSYEVPATSLN